MKLRGKNKYKITSGSQKYYVAPINLNWLKINCLFINLYVFLSARLKSSSPPLSCWQSQDIRWWHPACRVRQRNTGLIDSAMTLTTHVNHLVGVCFFQLRQDHPSFSHHIRRVVAHSLVRALIHARVDYCNGLLASCPKNLNEKLQSVLRAAARLVLQHFFKHNFCVKPYVPREPRRDPSNRRLYMNMGYIFYTAKNRTHNLFRPKREPIPLGHSDGQPFHIGHLLLTSCTIATLAWHPKSGEVQDWPARVQVSPWVGSLIPIWLLATASQCQYRPLAPPCVHPGFRSVFSSSLERERRQLALVASSMLHPPLGTRSLTFWAILNSSLAVLGTNWKLSFSPKFNASHVLIFVVR